MTSVGEVSAGFLLSHSRNFVVSVRRSFLLWVFGKGYVILFWYSLGLPYNYFTYVHITVNVIHAFLIRTKYADEDWF